MKNKLNILLFVDFICIIMGVLIIYVLGYAEIYLLVALGVVAVVTGLYIYNTNECRYFLAPTKKAIIYVDIVNYKLIKLYYGKKKAKQISCLVSDILFYNLKRGCVKRKGSNHYSVLFEYKNRNEIISYINKVSDGTFNLLNGDMINISLKFGIQICTEDDYETNENKAEIACINAKVDSETMYSFFDDDDASKLLEEKKMLDTLLCALKNKEFEIYFQPQYDYKSKTIVGSEALIRLIKEDKIIPASEFIEIAEKYDFTILLDKYVFKEVCRMISELKQNKIDFKSISVNVSRKTLSEKNMIEYYSALVQKYNIKKDEICLEITERSSNNNDINNVIKKLSKKFNISIDDYGVGSSSLSMIAENDIKSIKIDRKFIRDDSELGRKLLNSIIKLGNELGIELIAEGVEKEEELEYLKKKGCYIIQGKYYSKPLNYEEYIELLKNEE